MGRDFLHIDRALRSRIAARFVAACILLAAVATSASAGAGPLAVSSQPGGADPAVPNPLDTTPIDELIASSETAVQEARAQLDSARESEQARTPLQLGTSAEEIQERTALLTDLVRAHEQKLKALRRIKSVRESSAQLQIEMAAWDGFPDRSAVTIDLVDTLRDSIAMRNQDIVAAEAERSIVGRALTPRQPAVAEAEANLSRTEEALAADRDAAKTPYLRWLRDLADIRLRKAVAELDQSQTEKRALDEAIAHHQEARAFLETQFQVAAAQAPFSREALEAKLAALAEARADAEHGSERARQAHAAASQALDAARAALNEARQAGAVPKEDASAHARRLEALQQAVNEHEAATETAQLQAEVFELTRDLFESQEMVWRQRFDTRRALELRQGDRAELIARATDNIEATRGKLTHPRYDLETAARRTRTMIGGIEEQLGVLPPDSPGKDLMERILDSYHERGEACRTGLIRISDLDRLLDRWEEDLTQYAGAQSWSERMGMILRSVTKWGSQAWRTELIRVGDTAISVDKILLVLVILVIGFTAARRVASRVRRITIERFHVEEDVAVPIQTGVFYVLLVFVVLFALNAVSIPLTIFAYLGGALAIGVGFGAQNLIGNFISGLIMLLERPIKIGDIVEIEGVFGVVRNIGSRCSQVRRFDGVDLLIPNSVFLEKNVINWTLSDRQVRFAVSVGVAYGSPTRDVERLIRQAANEHRDVLRFPEPVVFFEDFGDNSLLFTLYVWIDLVSEADSRLVRSEIRHRIDELFREAGITISFPQRDVHLDVSKPIPVALTGERGPSGREDREG